MSDPVSSTAVLVVVVLVLVIGVKCVVRVPADHQGILVLLGSYRRTLHPGSHLVHPLARVIPVDLRRQRLVIPVPTTQADRSTRAVASMAYRIVDAKRSVFQVADLAGELESRLRSAVGARIAVLPPGAGLSPIGPAVAAELAAGLTPLGVQVEEVAVYPPGVPAPVGTQAR